MQFKEMPTSKSDRLAIRDSVSENPFFYHGGIISTNEYWSFGSMNTLPYVFSTMARSIPVHRRILNDKTNYSLGRGLSCDDKNKELVKFLERCNSSESLTAMARNVLFDHWQGGNSYIEIVTNTKRSFLSIFHHDWTKCRLSKDKKNIIINPNWCEYHSSKNKEIPIYPEFVEQDGYLRSMIQIKSYEPMFENYGIPDYIAGMNVNAIAFKTDKWNISRLDNSFQMSGIFEIDADEDDEERARDMKNKMEKKFAGKPGQVAFFIKNKVEQGRGSKFTPIDSNNEGDWIELHEMSNNDIIVAHSWFKELSGFDFSSGFSSERILYAYEITMNNLISPVQNKILEAIRKPIEDILKIDASSLQFSNRPPITVKPKYMKIWEARKIDGLDYDENDPEQNKYLGNVSDKSASNK